MKEQLWPLPPMTKIIEAYGCVGDRRVETAGNEGKVYSSSRNKFYTVKYDPIVNSISSNDNLSFFVGYMGYPQIAFLMAKGIVSYNPDFTVALSGFPWKDINQSNKNDFEKTNETALKMAESKGFSRADIEADAENVMKQIKRLKLVKVRSARPPKGY
jgi:hypothetical protein